MILKEFRYHFERLFKSNIDEFIIMYILKEIPAAEMMAIGAPFILNEDTLQHKVVLTQTVKILTLMKLSADNNEFTKLQKKLMASEQSAL